MRLLIVTFITLLVTSVTFGQTIRPNSVRWNSLNKSVRDSIRTGQGALQVAADTTALKVLSTTSKTAMLTEISSGVGGGGQFVYKASGYTADRGAILSASDGGLWVREDLIANKPIQVAWYGSNAAAVQSAIDQAETQSYSTTVILPPGTTNIGSTTLTIEKNSIVIKGHGFGSKIKYTGNSAAIKFPANNDHRNTSIENVHIEGPGKDSTASVGIDYYQITGQLTMRNVNIDSFGVGRRFDNNTLVLSENVSTYTCGTALFLGYQSDAHTYISDRFQTSDSGVVVGQTHPIQGNSSNANPVNFIGCVFGYDSVAVTVYKSTNMLNFTGCYFEGNRTEGLIGDGTVVGNQLNFVGCWWQQTAWRGLIINDQGSITMWNCAGQTETISQNFIQNTWIANDASFLTLMNNRFTGSYKYAEMKATSHIYDLNENMMSSKLFNLWYGGSTTKITSDGVLNIVTPGINDEYLMRIVETSFSGNPPTEYWSAFAKGSSAGSLNKVVLGVDNGYIAAGSNSDGPPTASSSLRGYIYNRQGSPDYPLICMYTGSGYKWWDIVVGNWYGEGKMADQNAFTGTALHDTVVVSGITTTDVFDLTILDISPVANDMLSYTVTTDTLFVHRVAGTTSGLQYSWIRRKDIH